MNRPERILRGRQIVRLWSHMNYEEEIDVRDTVIDIFTDIFHYLQNVGVSWTDVVSNAEKWGLAEQMADRQQHPTEGWEQRMLDAIRNHDPLAVNDPDEEDE